MQQSRHRILFVDDDVHILESFKAVFRKDYIVETCSSAASALELLDAGQAFSVIISDMRMPGMDGVDFLRLVARRDPMSRRIMLTGHADLETAMAAVNDGGISHFLTKPCPTNTLKEAIESCLVNRAAEEGEGEEDMPPGLAAIVGKSTAITRVRAMLRRLGNVDATVLFTGESGTGKSHAAEILHSLGSRGKGPFVRVNCPSLSPGVFEAELFGSVRGAYTGSVHSSTGRFMAANTGSILLDEIADVPFELQAKLLQVIERKEFERVGEHRTTRVDVRIMAATNADLKQCVAQGRFRNDLYYRLNVMQVELPPLRTCLEDIPLLARHFLKQMAAGARSPEVVLSDGALQALCGYSWPGNVRELRHALERGAMFCDGGVIRRCHLPEDLSGRDPSAFEGPEAEPERERLLAALKGAGWNKARAARELGMSRSTLYRRMQEADIPTDESLT